MLVSAGATLEISISTTTWPILIVILIYQIKILPNIAAYWAGSLLYRPVRIFVANILTRPVQRLPHLYHIPSSHSRRKNNSLRHFLISKVCSLISHLESLFTPSQYLYLSFALPYFPISLFHSFILSHSHTLPLSHSQSQSLSCDVTPYIYLFLFYY